jgi:uncharacterized Zn-finger protein
MATWLYVMNGLHPPEQRLDEQGVRNNSKIMVLRVNEEDRRRQITEEEQKKNQKESIDRTQKGFQILSERGVCVCVCVCVCSYIIKV